MKLELAPINIDENNAKEIYASEDCQNLINMWKEYYPKIGFHLPWVGYFIKDADQIVGSCAFTGKPVNNKVEISYWTFKKSEGKGISTWACKELISIAHMNDPNVVITAKTAPETNPSTKILQRNGFVFSGVVQDDEIGDAWEWTLPK